MTSYFVYYRLAPSHAAEITGIADTIFRQVHGATGISGRLMRRDDSSDTWMEIYENVSDKTVFEAALAQAVHDTRFDSLLRDGSGRHIERFAAISR